MDINEIKFDASQFSLESIMAEFGGKSSPETPIEPVAEPEAEVSHKINISQDSTDEQIYTGSITDERPSAGESTLDRVDRMVEELLREKGGAPAPKAEPEVRSEVFDDGIADDGELSPLVNSVKPNVFIISGKSPDDEQIIAPDVEVSASEIRDSGEYAEADEGYPEQTEAVISDREVTGANRKKPKSFKSAVGSPMLSFLAILGVRIGQTRGFFTAAPPEEEADLGEELSPAKAARFYESRSSGLVLRARVSLILTAVLMYISFGFPVMGAMNEQAVSAAVCLIMLLTVMLLGLDIITSGLTVMGKKRLNANSLVALSCIFSIIDGFVTACGVKTSGLPFCAVSALTLTLSLMGGSMNCRANSVVFRIAASSRRLYTLSAETDEADRSTTLLKSNRGTKGFVRRTEEAGPDELVFGSMAPIIVPAALVLGIAATAITGNWSNTSHIISGIFVFIAPASCLFFFAFPYYISTLGLAPHGSCIAGWSGLYDMGKSKDIIITDRDLFDKEAVSVKQLRILAGADPKEVISMVGSIMRESDCAMSHAFDELMDKGSGRLLKVDNFRCHESGGLMAIINGKEVYCGSSAFMQLMNVRLVDKVVSKSCVYLAVNGVLSGIFEMDYTADKNVQESLQKLLASSRHPIFAIRDFNLTPIMLSRKFDTPTDGFDFPTFAKRYSLSSANPSEHSKPAAVLSKEGLEAYVDLSDHGKRLYRLINISGALSVLSSVIGILLMFIFFAFSSGSLTGVSAVLIYMLAWLLPEIIMALSFKTE